jgi:hypothetical protein
VGFGFAFGVGVGAGVGVGVWVGVGAAVAVGPGVAAAVGAGAGSTVDDGPAGEPVATGCSGSPSVPEPVPPVTSEPVAPPLMGPGCVCGPSLAPGPGATLAAGAAGTSGIGPIAALGAPSITTFAGSRPSDAGSAGARTAVPMTTAMIIAGIRTTAATLADRI